MGQFNYTIAYKPGKYNTVADALYRCPDYVKQSKKCVHFADQMGFPLYEVREFAKSAQSGFVEVLPGTLVLESKTGNIYRTSGSKSSISRGTEGTAAGEVQSDIGTKFINLRQDADKFLVGSSRFRNTLGQPICGEQDSLTSVNTKVKGHHPSTPVGLLTSVVLEPGCIARVAAAQENAAELSKCKELVASIDNDEFEFRTIDEELK